MNTTSKPKLICPDCGIEMNHHAMKIDYNAADPALVDPVFGGVVQEAHSCPECGQTSLRKAKSPSCRQQRTELPKTSD